MTKRRIHAEPRKPWTPAEDEILRQRVPDEPTAVVAAALGRTLSSTFQRSRKLGVKKSAAYLASPAAGRIHGGFTPGAKRNQYSKGHVPANKGLRGRKGWAPGRMAEGQFKPGCRSGIAAKNWMPIGSIVFVDGYLRLKVREAVHGAEPTGYGNTKVWPLLQRHVWEQANGPIPAKHLITFRDGNSRNCAIENLELVSRADWMRRHAIHNLPPELKQTVQLLGRVNRAIRKREKNDGQEQDQRSA